MEPQIGQKALVWPLLCFAALFDVELPRPRNSALERPRDGIAADADEVLPSEGRGFGEAAGVTLCVLATQRLTIPYRRGCPLGQSSQ